VGSGQTDIETSYDVSDAFFRLWLDEEMSTCVRAFERHYSNLAQFELRRTDHR
jgi:cyclopropane fatty-acyl-phospholipid synthase-like methyltransferase